jgi:alpha-glucosidase
MYVDDKTMNIMGKRTDGSRRNELIVRVYPDGISSSFTLYEDDGKTIAYQNGEVRTTVISQLQADDGVTVTIGDASGSYMGSPSSRDNVIKLFIKNPNFITGVVLNGNSLPKYATLAEFDAANTGWHNAGNNLVVAKSGDMNMTSIKTFEFRLGNNIYLPITLMSNLDQGLDAIGQWPTDYIEWDIV